MRHLSKQTYDTTNDTYDFSNLEAPYVIWDPDNVRVIYGPVESSGGEILA